MEAKTPTVQIISANIFFEIGVHTLVEREKTLPGNLMFIDFSNESNVKALGIKVMNSLLTQPDFLHVLITDHEMQPLASFYCSGFDNVIAIPSYFSEEKIVNLIKNKCSHISIYKDITRKEIHTFQYYCLEGMSAAQVSIKLNVSVSTVYMRLSKISHKLGYRSIGHLCLSVNSFNKYGRNYL